MPQPFDRRLGNFDWLGDEENECWPIHDDPVGDLTRATLRIGCGRDRRVRPTALGLLTFQEAVGATAS